MPRLVSTFTVHAMLEGLVALGLDRARLNQALGEHADVAPTPGATVGADVLAALWAEAVKQRTDPALATALGLAIPFGAFGFTDYLAGSSRTVGGGFESLAQHLKLVAGGISLELETVDGVHWVNLRTPEDESPPYIATEMTVAVFTERFRLGTDGKFQPAFVCLRCDERQGGSPQARLLGIPVRHASPVAALAIPESMWALRLRRADAYLQGMLERSVSQLGLAGDSAEELETAIRARLRDALADHGVAPQRMARLLGMSKRTLQRRLARSNRTFRDVVEAFRKEEACRLLGGALPIIEIAERLGYSEQTSFNRAFRRWTGRTPGQWRKATVRDGDSTA
jgi:AraC-like DNA-binding protein